MFHRRSTIVRELLFGSLVDGRVGQYHWSIHCALDSDLSFVRELMTAEVRMPVDGHCLRPTKSDSVRCSDHEESTYSSGSLLADLAAVGTIVRCWFTFARLLTRTGP